MARWVLWALGTACLVAAQGGSPFVMTWDAPGTVGYDQVDFVNALVIGNGRLGASTYGQPAEETITINEDSIWTGADQDRVNPNGPAALPALRTALLQNNVTGAANILQNSFLSNPTTSREYAFLADLVLTFNHSDYSNYQRTLDIQNALTTVTYTSGGVKYTREWIASYPAKTIIGQISASSPGALSFSAQWNRTGLTDGTRNGSLIAVGKNGSMIAAGLPSGAPNYAGLFSIFPNGGSISQQNGLVTIKNANSAMIVIGAETDYWNAHSSMSRLQRLAKQDVQKASHSSFSSLYSAHTSDFRSFFDRANLYLGGGVNNQNMTLNNRFSAYQNGAQDYALEALMWAFGRYMMISSSRQDSLPPNLIGIWNNNNNPGWGGKFTTDLNVEMNHWLTETTGLSEMSEQLFDFTATRVQPNGENTAKVLYNCSGWVSHHNNDLWGDTAPHDDGTAYTWWTSGGVWPMTWLYEHWRFTGDNSFLKTTALPILTGIVEFYQDFLIERNGYLVTAPSASTENSYYTPGGVYQAVAIGPTSDSYYLREIFTNFLNASSLVGSTHMVQQVQKMLSKIRTPFIPNYYGGIQQWWDDWQEASNSQPMMDPILGLYPFAAIPTWQPNGNVTQMAEKSLNNYLGETAGNSWSIVWPIAYFARLWQGSNAYEYIQKTLQGFISSSGTPWTMNAGYYQIDGNLGFPAVVTEMLLQSQGPQEKWPIMLLPALPPNWQSGWVHGLVARGGFEVNIEWANGAFKQANLYSRLGWNMNVTAFNLPTGAKQFYIKELNMYSGSQGWIFIHSTQGKNYTILPSNKKISSS